MPETSASRSRRPWRFALAAILSSLVLTGAGAQEGGAPSEIPSEDGGGHFAAPDPADLTAEQASQIYRDIRDQMIRGYRLSGDNSARNFPRWDRFNTAPYRSATHGERFVNNYANARAQAYGRYEEAGPMPPGAVVVKDTFYVSQAGDVFPGALMVMEKMPAGFDESTGDWRYSMIMPDGSLFGATGGVNAEAVVFCADCHALAAAHDHLFFIPDEFRVVAE